MKVHKMKVAIQSSAIIGFHEFHARSQKVSDMLILVTPIVLLTKVILGPYARLKVHC